MEYKILNNGIKMPVLGFGTYQIPSSDVEQLVLKAIDYGYRLIDTAQIYGTEPGIGKAIAKTNIPRSELFITTKIWVTNAGYEKTKASLKRSLKNLQTDYIDLVLIHQPYNDYYGTWKALEEAVEQGIVKAIGVSNFSQEKVEDLTIWNKIKPAINQIELNPFFQREDDVKFLKSKDIAIESWASFAEGRNNIFANELLKKIGNKYNKSVAQVILRWLIQRDITVIPKSVTPSRIEQNIDVFDFQLTEQEMNEIKELNTKKSLFFDHETPEAVDRISGLK